MNEMVELCAEATRLAEPLGDPGPSPVDGTPLLCTGLVDWERQYSIAVLTLACFADWDTFALRKAQRLARWGDGQERLLLWSAAELSEWAPVHRLALMTRA